MPSGGLPPWLFIYFGKGEWFGISCSLTSATDVILKAKVHFKHLRSGLSANPRTHNESQSEVSLVTLDQSDSLSLTTPQSTWEDKT